MNRELTFVITETYENMKIEEFLKELGCSHHILTHLKRTERGIELNGEWAYASTRLRTGDRIHLRFVEELSSDQIVPSPLPLDVIFEDEDLLVVNKPAGMPIHPSINHHENTLANLAVAYYRNQPFVYRCINRLDRDTSGLLIIAKNMFSASLLYRMSSEHQIHRQYIAVAEGMTPESGTIDAPIGRKRDSAIMRCIDYDAGDSAVTHYSRQQILRIDERDYSLLKIRLETGRTHQIRVHFSSIGHPLAGDFLYNPDSASPFARQALHSWFLSFVHPVTGETKTFTAPLPDDLRKYLPEKYEKPSLFA